MISATACHSVQGKAAGGCSDAIDWPTAFTLHTAGNHLRASTRHFCSSAPQYFLLHEFPNQCRAPRASYFYFDVRFSYVRSLVIKQIEMISATACHSVPGKAAGGCSDAIDWPTAFTLHTAGNHLRALTRHFCSSAPQYFLLYEFPNQCRAPRASRTAEPDQRDGRFFSGRPHPGL